MGYLHVLLEGHSRRGSAGAVRGGVARGVTPHDSTATCFAMCECAWTTGEVDVAGVWTAAEGSGIVGLGMQGGLDAAADYRVEVEDSSWLS